MFRAFAITAVLSITTLPPAAGSETPGRVKVCLLPMKLEAKSGVAAVSDESLSTALLIEVTRTAEFQLVEFITVSEAFEDQLVDDAVFELLVTHDLRESLRVLDTFGTEAGKRRFYSRTANRLGIRYLIEATCRADRTRAEISYRLIDAGANLNVFARTLAGGRNGLAGETAKRMTRDLWRVRHSQ